VSSQGEWKHCRTAWCGKYYIPTKWDNYPVKDLKTEDGLPVVVLLRDKHNYGKARICDFLCVISSVFSAVLGTFRNVIMDVTIQQMSSY
jgi:hypothetical protein